MALTLETREQWGARPPTNRRYVGDRRGVVLHWPGANARFGLLPHSDHRSTIKAWQNMHMSRGSNDIEYGSILCPCGTWIEGRTEQDKPFVRVGSNGTAASNAIYTSINIMLGISEPLTDPMIQNIGEAVARLRQAGWGRELIGHRDVVGTACPGDAIYRAIPQIHRAADRWSPQTPTPEEDEVVVIFMNHEGKRYAAYPSAGVKRHLRTPKDERDIRTITERAGGRVIEWAAGVDVDNPWAFGETI